MYLQKKGTAPAQAHVGIPEGLYEEEHGREGFSGPSSHLYRTHPPTGWSRIEGPLRPRAFQCAGLPTADQRAAEGKPSPILESSDARVFISGEPRPCRISCGTPTATRLFLCIAGRAGAKRIMAS